MVTEYGSNQRLRFLTESSPESFNIDLKKNKEEICLDCDAKLHAYRLENINFQDPTLNLIQTMEEIKEALLFVLNNTKWPISE